MSKRRTANRLAKPRTPAFLNRNEKVALKEFESNITTDSVQNSLGAALGFNSNLVNFGAFGLGGGNPWAPQISQVNTIFENLRWYLISNFRQPLSEAYVELGLVQSVVDLPVDDALRGGIEISSKQLDDNQIMELQISLDRDDDLNTIGQAAKWNRLFGGAGVLMIIGDEDYETPMNIRLIRPDTPVEFRAVDMWELFWDKQNASGYDPEIEVEDFDYYNYYGHQVHKSRVMRMKGLIAPSFIKPRLRGWGFSVVEILIRSINQYLKATDLAFACLDEFKVDVYKIKNLINTLMMPDGGTKIAQRIAMANWQKNYQNALVMDSEDDWDHKQLSFAGIAETMEGIRMQVAADMRMPITKLFGTSTSKGLSNGDQNDLENYNSMVESQVRNKIKYDILRVLEIKSQKLFQYIPDDLQIEFKPLRVLSALDEETVKTSKFTRLMQASQLGKIDDKQFIDACNRDNLLGIQIDTPDDLLNPIDPESGEVVKEGLESPYKPESTDDPGADREDRRTIHAWSPPKVGDSIPPTVNQLIKPRWMNEGTIPAQSQAKDHGDVPIADKKINPESQEKPKDPDYEAQYDLMSYEFEGGNDWIKDAQLSYFRNPSDLPLWEKSKEASLKYLHSDNEKYRIWWYRKKGGGFKDPAMKK